STIEHLPEFPVDKLENDKEQERAMQILSYIGHAYVWGHKEPPQSIPAILAKPWYEVATKCNRLPVLSYASYALTNWKRINKNGPIDLGNIVLIQNFLGGIDEEWFILIHVAIEAQSIPALNACLDIVHSNNASEIEASLKIVEKALKNMCETLDRMPEACDPYIYYTRVRPYIFGWKNHPLFPNGLIYEGVYDNKPQQFRGETGAQSSIIPTLDGLLGITHTQDMLYTYLQEMRQYMPKPHREFLAYIESQSKLRSFVQANPALKPLYNSCITLINRFRQTHLKYAATYIQKQHQATAENPTAVGTGGTPFMTYLKKHQDETEKFLLD
ncbi:MAG: indoleamine 2,3-dioxygenase, partial [Chlamydiales bacterium]|nr:indoleamine 2,3-dioxygenase [Chlamydiales bacterium]